MKHIIFLFVSLCFVDNSFATDTTLLNNYNSRILKVFNQGIILDSQFIIAVKTKNPVNIERARISLLDYANNGIRQLDSIANFENDASLKFSFKDVLKFYKQLAEYDIPQVRDFFIVEQNFLMLKKEFDKKPVKKHSQEEIIAYNSEANKYNQAVTRFTQMKAFIDASRKHTLYNWNASQKIFMDTHISKFKK